MVAGRARRVAQRCAARGPGLPALTEEVLTAHLMGDAHRGLYPLLEGDRCWWLAADFDGDAAMLDALAYLKAARALGVPGALEVSRSGVGAHVWVFFTAPVAAETARNLGTGLLREAMALRGRMSLASYDRLFPSQDVLPVGGVGNLIAAPLHGRSRADGTTVFLDTGTMEPHEGVPVDAVAHDAAGGVPPGGSRRHRGGRPGRRPDAGRDRQPYPTRIAAGSDGAAGGGCSAGDRGADARPARHPQARGFNAQPVVRRAAADAPVDLGCAALPGQLR